jgi:hypothetical protein
MKKAALIACAFEALLSHSLAGPPALADRISYTDITFNTVPQGAAIVVDGRFFGYSPVVIHARLVNGRLPDPIIIDCIPTKPGEFTQHGSVGYWQNGPFRPKETFTAYMYDTR